ncbi:alpha/beta fold hydrolase [Salinibius halmophilus]|uniref:alpha/beta fold hydrolase n=1 Tax=Salinibius halmophilus TaxID=1853216 RepID=UPI000E66B192|nr:alpha/beta fold hydrolase [Salinibius halmophilus]
MARLLFLHGLLGQASDWDQVITALDGDATAITLPRLAVDNISQYAEQLWQQLDINEPVHLVGYSMGARIAMHWLKQPWVQSAVFEAGHPGNGADAKRLAHDYDWADKLRKWPIHTWLEAWYQQGVFNGQTIDIDALASSIDPTLQAYFLRTLSVAKQADLTNLLAMKPVTYVTGECDQKYTRLAAKLPVSRHRIVAGAGHNIHASQPMALAAEISQHLSELT